jgi:glycerophosphoryl diester phosphodiesterase
MFNVLAHRGDPVRFPENTLASFRAACDLHCRVVELDVQLSKDNIPVVIHDPTVDRTTNGKGKVKELTLTELKRLRIAESEEIPTLEEALRLMKGKTTVDIELKQFGDYYPGLEELTLDVVKKLGMEDQVAITAFDHYSIVRTRQLNERVEVGLINNGSSPALIDLLEQLKGRYLSIQRNYLTESYIRLCEQRGIQLIAWTIDDEAEMRRIAQYPSVLVCTNQLEKWGAVIGHSIHFG